MYIFLTGVIIFLIYLYGTRNFDYWSKRNIPFEKPMIFFGSIFKQYTQKISESERYAELYKLYPNEKCVGFFEGNKPVLIIKDPEMIKHVLLVDFKYFHHRGLNPFKDAVEPLLKNIFFADGDIWKLMRQKLTPTFSSGKLKAMFPLIVERAERLTKTAEAMASANEEVDVRELMARYTTDFIGACGFGIDADTLNNDSSDFRKLGKRIFTPTARDIVVGILKRIAPNIFKYLNFFDGKTEMEIVSLVREIMSQRDYKPSGRNDFIDLMLELKQSEKIVGESIEEFNSDGSPKIVEIIIDDLLLAAQVFIFFAAGFETSSYASSILLHILAYHPEEQVRCQQDIDKTLVKHDGKLSFDSVRDMKYLEMAFKESIRLFPSPGFLVRKCVKKYTFHNPKLTIDEGVPVFISTEALHLDERYFSDPEEFKPERFHPDNIVKIDKNVYMPFGSGPRTCIGERMGVMQSMAGVATILKNFTVAPSRSTVRKPIVDPDSGIVQTIKGGLPLSLKPRETFFT